MIDRQLHQRAKEILADALQLDPQDRAAFVSEAGASDLPLHDEVQSLLRFADGGDDAQTMGGVHPARGRLDALFTPSAVDTTRSPTDASGKHSADAPVAVGKYRISRMVGAGGMGRVYEAIQDKPRRRVALKLIRSAHGSDVLLRRFEYEAQTLGRLEHPGIARIYEAGSDEVVLSESPRVVAGPPQPFIAMEFIEGEPLDRYVARAALSIADRLRLFARVCEAVNHAHAHGVIHRDLKPSNILVTADGTPKILDFGIARAVEDDAALTMTHAGQPIGTPAYMSPEQAEGSRDIDTRTDVYSLGIILYELLTGATPFHQQQKNASHSELQRLIRDVTPPRPSTALADKMGSHGIGENVAIHDTRRIRSAIQGELDWIVMKAIEKDRARRYQSAAEFGDDIQRHLTGEAIHARPASALYQLRVFTRRHAALSTAIVAVFITLLGATIVSTAMYRNAEASRRRAVEAERKANLARRDEMAAKESAIASERAMRVVADFQARMLSQVDPSTAGAMLFDDIEKRYAAALENRGLAKEEHAARLKTFRELLQIVNPTDTAATMIDATVIAPAVKAVDAEFADQPAVAAALRQTLAELYETLGLYDEALPLHEQALAMRKELFGDDHPDTLDSMSCMADLLRTRGEYAAAREYIDKGLAISTRLTGPDSPETLFWVAADGALLCAEGKLNEAEPHLRRALWRLRELYDDDHSAVILALNNLGVLLRDQGKFAEAEPILRDCLERNERVYGKNHHRCLRTMNNLASVLEEMGRQDEAEALWRETLARTRRAYGTAHPETLTIMNNLAVMLMEQNRAGDAKETYIDMLDAAKQAFGELHPQTLALTGNIGLMFQELGDLAQAEIYYRQAYELKIRALGVDHPDTLISLHNLGTLQMSQGRWADAEKSLKTAMDGLRTARGDDHPSTLSTIAMYGWMLRTQGRTAEAEPFVREALERRRRVLGADHLDTLRSIDNLAFVSKDLNRLEDAEALFREALQITRGLSEASPAAPAGYLLELGLILNAQEKYAEAEPYLRECLALRARLGAPNDWRSAYVRGSLGESLAGQGKFEEAEPVLLDAWDAVKAAPGVPAATQSHDVRGGSLRRIVQLYERWDATTPGDGYDAKASDWRATLADFIASNPSDALPAATGE